MIPVPLSSHEFASLMAPLAPFEVKPSVAVAVSGGADSLCLALLAQDWAVAQGGEAVAVTVDHALRPESAAEAAQVGRWLAAAGMSHHVVTWEGPKPAADIQAAARVARYALLEEWCRQKGILHVLLAHHQDDQAETLMLRLARGSGVDGLAAMAPAHDGFWVRWLRPLLNVPHARLTATLTAWGQIWIEDPSNQNPKFARARMRALMPVLAAEGLTPQRLGDTARRLARARGALEDDVAEAAARWVRLHPAGFAQVANAAFSQMEDEVALRLLRRLLQALGGGQYPLRQERVEAMLGRLRQGLKRAVTLGGCRLGSLGDSVLICREAGRMAPAMALRPGAEMEWDHRFRFQVAADAPAGLSMAPLGATGWKKLAETMRPHRLPAFPAPVRATLPVVLDHQGICAVPHVGYNRHTEALGPLNWIVAAPPSPVTAAGRRLV